MTEGTKAGQGRAGASPRGAAAGDDAGQALGGGEAAPVRDAAQVRASGEPGRVLPVETWPEQLRTAEAERVAVRRKQAGLDPKEHRDKPRVGLALSGGGIRSATFSLGVVQALTRAGLLRHVDYLSTVSGGGYFGAFLGALFARRKDFADVERIVTDDQSTELRYLRRNGAYLAPAGRSDFYLAAAVLLRNVLAVHVVLLAFFLFLLLMVALLALLARSQAHHALVTVVQQTLSDFEYAYFDPEGLLLSPWLLLGLVLLPLLTVPLGWAYFTVGRSRLPSGLPFGSWLLARVVWFGLPHLCLAVGAALWLPCIWRELAFWLAGAAVFAAVVSEVRLPGQAKDGDNDVEGLGRHRLSRWLSSCLLFCGGLLALGAVDTVGRSTYAGLSGEWQRVLGVSGGTSGVLLLLATQASKLVQKMTKGTGGQLPRFGLGFLSAVGAFALGSVLACVASFGAHAIVWAGELPQADVVPPLGLPLGVLAALTVANVLIGSSRLVLNQSNHQPLYASRLTRSYLGASNPERDPAKEEPGWMESLSPARSAATRMLPSDDLETGTYFGWKGSAEGDTKATPPWQKGGPLHLVNVTINETIDGRARTAEPDRRGLSLTLGPVAVSVGARHHVVPGCGLGVAASPKRAGEHRVFEFGVRDKPAKYPEEQLTLGRWVSISGAAFSTGLGSRTRAGLSFFATLANVRLGHWWRPGVKRSRGALTALTGLFWVQTYLLRELMARFPGTSNRLWYLSDGGHFENMGGYELIRRRVELIVVVDAEQDGASSFEGLGNLVRKARLDFQTEIEFLPAPTTGPAPFGSLDDLRRNEKGQSRAHAALAQVHYPATATDPPRTGHLLYIKPTIVGALSADLEHYFFENPSFPHQPTSDQFFDEAQWESYRKLGLVIGERLFGESPEHRPLLSQLLRTGELG